MRLLISIVLLFIAAPTYAGIRVITTTTDIAAITRAVGGDAVSVVSLTRGTRDPHFAEARPSMIRQAYQADLLISIGAGMEVGWLPALLQASRNNAIQPGNPGYLDLSESVTLLGKPTGPVTRDLGDVHAEGNPHYWLDPNNGAIMAKAIASHLMQLDPDNSNQYKIAAETFVSDLRQRIPVWQKQLAGLQGKKAIAYHTSLLYLAHGFGFTIVDQVEPKPGIAPSPTHLQALVNRIKQEKIGFIIMEPYYEQRSSRWLTDKTNIKVVVIPQSVDSMDGVDSYIKLFDEIVSRLMRAQ